MSPLKILRRWISVAVVLSLVAVVIELRQTQAALQTEAYRTLREFGAAARSFRLMADYLERHPEALIRGKGAELE